MAFQIMKNGNSAVADVIHIAHAAAVEIFICEAWAGIVINGGREYLEEIFLIIIFLGLAFQTLGHVGFLKWWHECSKIKSKLKGVMLSQAN